MKSFEADCGGIRQRKQTEWNLVGAHAVLGRPASTSDSGGSHGGWYRASVRRDMEDTRQFFGTSFVQNFTQRLPCSSSLCMT